MPVRLGLARDRVVTLAAVWLLTAGAATHMAAAQTTEAQATAGQAGDTGQSGASTVDPASDDRDDGPAKPGYGLRITRNERALEIRGTVPGPSERNAIVSAASIAFPDLPLTIMLVDRPAAAPGALPEAPDGFAEAAAQAAALMNRLAEGQVDLDGQTVAFSGRAFHGAALAELAAATWPAGFSVDMSQVAEGPPTADFDASACEAAIEIVLKSRPIAFEAGRADIRGDGHAQIDRIAYTLARCPHTFVAVAGHTDSDGTDEANYTLSLNRARTLIDLLVADGVIRERFTALGYGESRPLASNGTLAGKARNRRIEFVLRD